MNAVVSGPLTDNLSGRLALSTEKRAASYEFVDGSPLGEEQTNAILGTLTFDLNDSTELKYTGYYVDAEDTAALSSINADVAEGDCNQTYSGNLRNIVTGEDAGAFTTDLSNLPGPVFDFATLTFLDADATLFCGSIPEWGGDNQINPAIGGAPNAADAVASGYATAIVAPSLFGDFIAAPDGLGNTYETWRHNISIDSDLDNGFSVGGFVSLGQYQSWGIFDSLYGANPVPTYAGFIRESSDTSAEARVSSPSDSRLRYTIGVNYYTQEADNYQIGFDILSSEEAETFGIFGAVDFDITDSITLSGEGRWQDDETTILQDGSPGTPFDAQSQGYTEFMPRVILSYQPEDYALNIYGSWSQRFCRLHSYRSLLRATLSIQVSKVKHSSAQPIG